MADWVVENAVGLIAIAALMDVARRLGDISFKLDRLMEELSDRGHEASHERSSLSEDVGAIRRHFQPPRY